MNRVHGIAEQFDANGNGVRRSGENFDDIAARPKCAAMKVRVVSRILNLHEFREDKFPPNLHGSVAGRRSFAGE